jgi:hypothetical protein
MNHLSVLQNVSIRFACATAFDALVRDYGLKAFCSPVLLLAHRFAVCWPTVAIAPMQAMTIIASMTAYSTAVAAESSSRNRTNFFMMATLGSPLSIARPCDAIGEAWHSEKKQDSEKKQGKEKAGRGGSERFASLAHHHRQKIDTKRETGVNFSAHFHGLRIQSIQ